VYSSSMVYGILKSVLWVRIAGRYVLGGPRRCAPFLVSIQCHRGRNDQNGGAITLQLKTDRRQVPQRLKQLEINPVLVLTQWPYHNFWHHSTHLLTTTSSSTGIAAHHPEGCLLRRYTTTVCVVCNHPTTNETIRTQPDHEVPIVIDTGASWSVTPCIQDFVTENKTSGETLQSLDGTINVQGVVLWSGMYKTATAY
jgi:hypothetical protein